MTGVDGLEPLKLDAALWRCCCLLIWLNNDLLQPKHHLRAEYDVRRALNLMPCCLPEAIDHCQMDAEGSEGDFFQSMLLNAGRMLQFLHVYGGQRGLEAVLESAALNGHCNRIA